MKQTLVTIYLGLPEDCSALEVHDLIKREWPLPTGLTIAPTTGLWQGNIEASCQISTIIEPSNASDYEELIDFAGRLQRHFNQSEVWVTDQPINLTIVSTEAIRR